MKEKSKIDLIVLSNQLFKIMRTSLFCVVVILVGCGMEPEDLSYKQHEYFPEFKKYCGKCHNLARPLSKRYDEEGWRKNIERMRAKDEKFIQAEDAKKILIFLTNVRPSK